MNTRLNQGSAKIYQFPAGGRAALGGRRYEDSQSASDLAASRLTVATVGGAWYHEAAIADAKPVRDR